MKQELLGARRSQDEADPKQDQIRQLGKLLRLDSGQLWIVEAVIFKSSPPADVLNMSITVFDIRCYL